DEPLSNLDAKLRVEMRDEIRAIQKQLGITAVYVTHDQEEALVISDRIAVVSGGRVQQVGAPWDIYKDPANLFVASFVGKVNLIPAELGEAAGQGFRKARAGKLELLVPAPEGFGKNTVIVAFRPEDAVENPQAKSGNLVAGKVLRTSFLGTVAGIVAECEGSTLIIDRHHPRAGDIPAPGDTIRLSLPTEGLMLFDPVDGARLRPAIPASQAGAAP
ncbi:MAG: ABC transporter ATP-binding protein, partial [Spirochaetota bacterium]